VLHDQFVGGAMSFASYSIRSDGKVVDQNGAVLETWLPSGQSAASYQVKAALISGTAPIGDTLGTWLSCSVSRDWSESATLGHLKECVIRVSIRDAASPNTVRTTADITISADNT
jgi:hypothetical protein